MGVDDPIYLDLLKENYETTRENANALRKQGHAQRAASAYRKCADLAEDIAEAEPDSSLAESWSEHADELGNVATRLQQEGTVEPRDDESRPDQSDTPSQRQEENDDGATPADEFVADDPEIDFSDVGGMTELKQELLDKIRDPIERRELYETYGIGVVNAILLYGPPGTGKTHITKALAGELDFTYIKVDADAIVSKYVGEAAENVARLFEVAVAEQPALIFLDEIDAISQKRAGETQQTQSQLQMVNQLLAEISEVKGEDVVIVGATNRPDIIDDALMDRFEDLIEVPLPDAEARAAIFRIHLREPPILSEQIDWDRIKAMTDGFSARDIETATDNAALMALNQARESDEIQPITQAHLEEAISNVEPIESEYGQLE